MKPTPTSPRTESLGVFGGLERLARDARALRPEVQTRLEREMDAVRMAWEIEAAARPTETIDILDQILLPYVNARVPLRPRAEGPAWAHAALLRLLERFEQDGHAHTHYDHDWRPDSDEVDVPEVLVRLALAAGWLGWSELLVDPAASLAHLDLLVELNDRVDEHQRRSERWATSLERDAAAAALELERRLLRHWRREPSSGARVLTS